jgi:hypothetical protein
MDRREFIEPVDCDGALVEVGDEVKSTPWLAGPEVHQGIVVEVGVPPVRLRDGTVSTNLIRVRCGTSFHQTAAFLWKVVGKGALS